MAARRFQDLHGVDASVKAGLQPGGDTVSFGNALHIRKCDIPYLLNLKLVDQL